MTVTDAMLADYLEDLLPANEVAAVADAVRDDAVVAGRLAALEAVLEEPVELPAVPLPEGLEDRVLIALETEGLIVDEAVDLPAGLLAATLTRLEDEGLVAAAAVGVAPAAPAGAAGAVIRPWFAWPAFATPLRAAAVILFALGLGWLVGRAPAWQVQPVSAELAALRLQIEALNGDVSAARDRRDEAESRAEAATLRADAGESTRADLASQLDLHLAESTARIDWLKAEAQAANGQLLAAQEQIASLMSAQQSERADHQFELEQLHRHSEELAVQLVSLSSATREAQRDVERTRDALGRAKERLVAFERADVDAPQRGVLVTSMRVAQAMRVERWNSGNHTWQSVRGGSALPAGTLLRSTGSRSEVRTADRRYRLGAGLFQVTDTQGVEPLPDPTMPQPAPTQPRAFVGAFPEREARVVVASDPPTPNDRLTPW
ncbi:hypothetical protein OAX78_03315 [Planctomycetota bacterium]|nr:hypothetical protein [Planctomycetota bacterium]